MKEDLETFFRRFELIKDEVYHRVLKIVANPEDAQDIMQEVWIKIQRNSPKLKIDGIDGWIFTVARNLALDQKGRNIKSYKQCILTSNLEDDDAIEEIYGFYQKSLELEIENKELHEALDICLLQLPPDTCTSIIRRSIEGLKYSDIAGEMKIPINTIKSRNRRGLEKMRKMLEGSEYLF